MEIVQPFLDAIRNIIREEIRSLPQREEERWIDSKELCEYLGVSRSWVTHRISKIPHIKEPLRFKKSEVDKWLSLQAENEVKEVHKKEVKVKKAEKKQYRVV